MSIKIRALAVVVMILSAAKAQGDDWDGRYAGVNLGYAPIQFSTVYEHQRLGGCVNLNFGSEWPGEGCEGNQDYSTQSIGRDSGRSVGLSIERLWKTPEGVVGLQLNLGHSGDQTAGVSQTISNTWGDRLNVTTQAGAAVDARLIYGVPVGNWMPFLSVGLGLLQLTTRYTQAHGGNISYPSVTREGDSWAERGIVGGGIKKDIGNDWILSADVAWMRTKDARFFKNGLTVDGGLTYPDTTIDRDTRSTEIRLGVSHRF